MDCAFGESTPSRLVASELGGVMSVHDVVATRVVGVVAGDGLYATELRSADEVPAAYWCIVVVN